MAYQLMGDKWLLQFEHYEDYLDSLVTPQDLKFLRNYNTARAIAELGYRNTGETLSREQFQKRRGAVEATLHPSRLAQQMCSLKLEFKDPLLEALAAREQGNRLGIMATIVFIRVKKRTGHEISGYIDYAQRITTEDWLPLFKMERRIWPRKTDLGYYHWRSGRAFTNSSCNYKTIPDPHNGLTFMNRNDHKLVIVDPRLPSPGVDSFRTRITSDKYLQVVLYDHLVRRKG